ncbi:zinc-binding alcohol dehydrogenase family protein [Rhizobium sp. BK251]|uniref:quinone oxidoreductase family protein n=1 Tax=Rhizobium sp. BK251 TaxID=2512125 RepID=UPI00104D58A9|nr:zinc-binding alcohol dehydrogenase family protein [Rhizobium sp. BK251]TCL71248.1 NADPH2:quinone reductase [Rhizobium sp. BK251]
MRSVVATNFNGYEGLKVMERPKPEPSTDRVLVRVTAAAINPLDHTILVGGLPRAKAPLVLGNEGAGIVEDAGPSLIAPGSRVAFTGPYGAAEDGTWQEYLLVRPEDLFPLPDSVDDVTAASMTVSYLTAFLSLRQAGFAPGKSVLAPAIGGSVGNAAYQLAAALGASRVISTAGSTPKAETAVEAGFDDVVDLSVEGLAAGVRRMTGGAGVDIVIDSLGGTIMSEAMDVLAMKGSLVSIGYSADRIAPINVTNLIWKDLKISGFSIFRASAEDIHAAWKILLPLISSGKIEPLIDRTFPLAEAGDGLAYLIEKRPFGKVVLTMEA